jgi:hypothetical protein
MLSKTSLATAISAALLSTSALALEQVVTPSQTSIEMVAGNTENVAIEYTTLDAVDTGVSAFTQWVFYDATALSVTVNDIFSGALGGAVSQPDSNDLDNDPTTDTYITLSWIDITFQNAWPGEYPAAIYNLDVETLSTFDSDTKINLLRDEANAVSNTTYSTKVINITKFVDSVAPTLIAPDAIALEAEGTVTAVTLGEASATDDFDTATPTISNNAPAQSLFTVGTHTVTWTATDSTGNESTATQTITISDTTKPVLSVAPSVVLEATAGITAVDLGQASATDLVDGSITPTADATGPFGLGIHTVTWQATDSAGNIATATQTVTIVDSTSPTIVVPAGITTEATGALTAVQLGTATATDSVDDNVTISADIAGPFAVGTHTVTWTATDDLNNQASATQTIMITDSGAPVFASLPDVMIEASAALTPLTLSGINATDAVDGSVSASNNANTSYAVGSYPITWTATDSAGNSASTNQTLIVQDTIAPSFESLADISVFEASGAAQVTVETVTASDTVSGVITATTDFTNGSYDAGTYDITWSATDVAGNTATKIQKLIVSNDNTAPVFDHTGDLPDIVVEATSALTAASLASVTATDDGKTLTAVADNVGPYAVGTHVITWTATDAGGNSSTAQQNVIINDTTAPIITAETAITLEADSQQSSVPSDLVSAVDLVDGDVITLTHEPSVLSVGDNVITWTATDTAGNVATLVQTVEVVDSTTPVFDFLPVVTLNATGRLTLVSADNLEQAMASDVVDGLLNAEITSDTLLESGINEVTWTVTDAAGNTEEAQQVVHINPIANFTINTFTEVGSSAQATVYLSGKAAVYPVELSFIVAGTAAPETHTASANFISITEGTSGEYEFNLVDDTSIIEGDTVELMLNEASNAVIGQKDSFVTTAVESNKAPIVSLTLKQGDSISSVITKDGDSTVRISADVFDINASDTHNIVWNVSDNSVTNLGSDADPFTFEIDIASLNAGSYVIKANVSENGDGDVLSSSAELLFVVADAAPVLTAANDSDNDGINDADEGIDDTDGDGIPDYKDNNDDLTLLPLTGSSELSLSTEAGLTLKLGKTALAASGLSADGASLQQSDLENFGSESGTSTDNAIDHTYDAVSAIVDFEIAALPEVGMAVSIIIPIPTDVTIPLGAVYRKYDAENGWVNFIEDGSNALASAPLNTEGLCPDINSSSYINGLNVGDSCIRVTLADGGENDQDGEANGIIVDPAMIAVENLAPVVSITALSTVDEGDNITLDASGSSDPEGASLTYTWSQLSGPTVTLPANDSIIVLQAPEVTQDSVVELQVSVSDGGQATTETVSFTVVETPSAVNAAATVSGEDALGLLKNGATATLSAAGSTDSEDNPLTYTWSQISGPAVSLSSTTSETVTFEAPEVSTNTEIVFSVTVSNGIGAETSTDTAQVNSTIAKKSSSKSRFEKIFGGSFGVFGLLFVAAAAIRRRML